MGGDALLRDTIVDPRGPQGNRLCQVFNGARTTPGRLSQRLGSICSRTHETISVVAAPGVKILATPSR